MDKVTQRVVTQRLASASGHVLGIERMVRNDAYCIDVITQIRAVQAALDKISVSLLDGHLRTCVATAVQDDDRQERVRVLAEVLSLFDMSRHLRGREVNNPNSQEGDSDMTTKTFSVPNISCGGCANTIERKVGQLAGVTGVRAVPTTKQVTVNWEEPATWEKIQGALQEINYPPEGFVRIA
jgi:DNA-binding FrmR family transcriptional regulator/copper chaperone CopZ